MEWNKSIESLTWFQLVEVNRWANKNSIPFRWVPNPPQGNYTAFVKVTLDQRLEFDKWETEQRNINCFCSAGELG